MAWPVEIPLGPLLYRPIHYIFRPITVADEARLRVLAVDDDELRYATGGRRLPE
ncbi:MAG: hypothetical protein KDJ22_03630 [Candidatus Competibacteraceae bacterium]|nr:hypothetical protein [Candidatus Competibacteraceae bacterium]MCP5126135.1 hypothetical protein [Gammaproteobacteria bacterium]HRX71215.1 hypothetical protein [Candidatus Competibacteraceae bacterium]